MNKLKNLVKTPQGAAGAVAVLSATAVAVSAAYLWKKGVLTKTPVITDLPAV